MNATDPTDTLVDIMADLSPYRVKRFLKKSASEQYKFAKALSSEQRSQLEQALERRFRGTQDSDAARRAMTMWLSVQQARLRTHSPVAKDTRRSEIIRTAMIGLLNPLAVPLAAALAMHDRNRYYCDLLDRPEYTAAIGNYMRLLGDESGEVSIELQAQALNMLHYHLESEGTITPLDQRRFTSSNGIYAAVLEAREQRVNLGNIAVAQELEATASELANQTRTLGEEIKDWLPVGRHTTEFSAFDGELYSRTFARLMKRVREHNRGSEDVINEGIELLEAIGRNADLRALVFATSEVALGTCHDNVREGFANILLLVRNHSMAEQVRKGSIDTVKLQDWGSQQFRLAALESEVHAFIKEERKLGIQLLDSEPLETMLHAKVALRERLKLPESVPKALDHQSHSVLTDKQIEALASRVEAREMMPNAVREFLVENETWRAGMKQLYAEAFQTLQNEFEDDPFYDTLPPPVGDEHVEAAAAYNIAAERLRQRQCEAEKDLLWALAVNPIVV